MKKLKLSLMTALLLLTIIPTQLNAETKNSIPSVTSIAMSSPNTAVTAEANILLSRLDNIKAMDKSTLNAIERKQLRKEVRSIKSQLSEMGGGMYLSVGAILIIALILILLL